MIIESHGVTAELDPQRFDDPRLTYTIAKLSSDRTPDERKMGYYADMLDMIFGEDNALSVMDDLAAANGGTLTNDLFNDFFVDVMGQVGAKN
jgi:hypothetical protein